MNAPLVLGLPVGLAGNGQVILVWIVLLGIGVIALAGVGLAARRSERRWEEGGIDVEPPRRRSTQRPGPPMPRSGSQGLPPGRLALPRGAPDPLALPAAPPASPPGRPAQPGTVPPRRAPEAQPWGLPGPPARPPRIVPGQHHQARLRARAEELAREASGTAGAAQRAAGAVAQAQSRLANAQRASDVARRAWEKAKRLADATDHEIAEEAARGERTDEQRGLEREVSRAALDAYRRGDISVDEMQHVWRKATGQDEETERRQKEAKARRASEKQALLAYQNAATAERRAQEEAEVAAVAAHALAEEAAEAAAEAGAARSDVDDLTRRSGRG